MKQHKNEFINHKNEVINIHNFHYINDRLGPFLSNSAWESTSRKSVPVEKTQGTV